MARSKGQLGKPTLFNTELQRQGYTIQSFHDKMREKLLDMPDLPNDLVLWPPVPINYIALLKSGKKNICQCSASTIYKICYTLDCSPNVIMPNIKEGETALWK
jgi:hypothetical protein